MNQNSDANIKVNTSISVLYKAYNIVVYRIVDIHNIVISYHGKISVLWHH